jgi:hypothetical protein
MGVGIITGCLAIGAVASMLGVSTRTLRRWDKAGTIKPAFRTAGNHRRYDRHAVLDEIHRGTTDDSGPSRAGHDVRVLPRAAVYSRVSLHDVKRRRVSRLFTAVRGIIALAFAANEAIENARFKSVLVPDNCVTRPYTSSKRTKRYLPINLLFNKYVVIRKEHPAAIRHVDGRDREAFLDNDQATEILRQGKLVWLGIPIYSPTQFDAATRRLSGDRKGVFWFEYYQMSYIRMTFSFFE